MINISKIAGAAVLTVAPFVLVSLSAYGIGFLDYCESEHQWFMVFVNGGAQSIGVLTALLLPVLIIYALGKAIVHSKYLDLANMNQRFGIAAGLTSFIYLCIFMYVPDQPGYTVPVYLMFLLSLAAFQRFGVVVLFLSLSLAALVFDPTSEQGKFIDYQHQRHTQSCLIQAVNKALPDLPEQTRIIAGGFEPILRYGLGSAHANRVVSRDNEADQIKHNWENLVVISYQRNTLLKGGPNPPDIPDMELPFMEQCLDHPKTVFWWK